MDSKIERNSARIPLASKSSIGLLLTWNLQDELKTLGKRRYVDGAFIAIPPFLATKWCSHGTSLIQSVVEVLPWRILSVRSSNIIFNDLLPLNFGMTSDISTTVRAVELKLLSTLYLADVST